MTQLFSIYCTYLLYSKAIRINWARTAGWNFPAGLSFKLKRHSVQKSKISLLPSLGTPRQAPKSAHLLSPRFYFKGSQVGARHLRFFKKNFQVTFYKYVIVYKCLEQVHNINMQCYNLVSEYCDLKKKYSGKRILTERGFIWLTFSRYSLLFPGVKAGTWGS